MKKLRGPGSGQPPAAGWIFVPALLLALTGQPGCKKSEAQPQLSEYIAVLNLANPGVDGPRVDELILDSTQETLVPINKKEGWPQMQTGPTPVAIRFIDAGKNFTEIRDGQTRHFREVYVVSFRLL
jgi:hypothetical protein